jgi:hypothetical protein
MKTEHWLVVTTLLLIFSGYIKGECQILCEPGKCDMECKAVCNPECEIKCDYGNPNRDCQALPPVKYTCAESTVNNTVTYCPVCHGAAPKPVCRSSLGRCVTHCSMNCRWECYKNAFCGSPNCRWDCPLPDTDTDCSCERGVDCVSTSERIAGNHIIALPVLTYLLIAIIS